MDNQIPGFIATLDYYQLRNLEYSQGTHFLSGCWKYEIYASHIHLLKIHSYRPKVISMIISTNTIENDMKMLEISRYERVRH